MRFNAYKCGGKGLPERRSAWGVAMVKTKLRLALTVVFIVLGAVLLFKYSSSNPKLTFEDDYSFGTGQGLQLRKLSQPFSWHESGDDESEAEAAAGEAETDGGGNKTAVPATCRNSVQGKILIADDKGFICHRQDVMATGCCNPNSTTAVRYACGECQEVTGCCKVYEHCISCCMDPKKKPVLMNVLDEASRLKNILLLSVADHFELCLAKCRTSSRSVQHENVYINPVDKHCYVKGPQTTTSQEPSKRIGDEDSKSKPLGSPR